MALRGCCPTGVVKAANSDMQAIAGLFHQRKTSQAHLKKFPPSPPRALAAAKVPTCNEQR